MLKSSNYVSGGSIERAVSKTGCLAIRPPPWNHNLQCKHLNSADQKNDTCQHATSTQLSTKKVLRYVHINCVSVMYSQLRSLAIDETKSLGYEIGYETGLNPSYDGT
jgi:hypothetical protein